MTNTPGDGQPPQDPNQQPYGQQPGQAPGDPGQQPGYWEQQQQPPQPQPYPPQPYGQPGYPVQFAPDHPKATTSLVLGILGVVLCSVLAPFAWKMGKQTVDEIDASQGQLGGRGAAQAGYIMGIIGTVLLGIGLVLIVLWVVFVALAIGGGIATSGSG